MKYFLLFLLFPSIGIGQEPPKKATRIIVRYDSSINSLSKIARKFYEAGYTIDQRDEANGFISSQDKASKKTMSSHRIKALIQDSVVVFTAVLALDVQLDLGTVKSERQYSDVYYAAKGNMNREHFLAMDAFVKSFGLPVRYEK